MSDSLLSGLALPGAAFTRARGALDAAGSPIDLARPPADAKAAAEDFEAFYLTQVMGEMFSGIETDPLFGGGAGETAFKSFLTQEYGKLIARAGGVGIADSVTREIIRLQEAQ